MRNVGLTRCILFMVAVVTAMACSYVLVALQVPKVSAACSGGISASQIDSYLRCHGSPMAGTGLSFESRGRQYNVDPRFMVAIAGAETSFGLHLGCRDAADTFHDQPYNAFNWFYQGCPSPFSSWENGIDVVTNGVSRSYLQAGQNTIASFVFGCGTHCYCPDCNDWYSNVRQFYAEQGGNPDTTDLTYTGNAGGTATVTDIPNPDAYSCSQPGYIDFEGLPEGTNLSSGTISGVQFSTTDGFTWLVGDFATGFYNGKYPNGGYTSQGTHWAWLGVTQPRGRIDFPRGPASYFSLLVSDNLSQVSLDAYDANSNLPIATAGPAPINYNTGHMAELRIQRSVADIHHVIVHDEGNYFLIDAVCTNAPETPTTIKRVVDQTYFMQTGQHVLGNFLVDFIQGAKQLLHFFLGPFFSDVDLNLTRPDGSIVSPTDPGVTYNKTPNSVEVTIDNAQAGTWQYEIIANQLDAGGENIHIVADVQTIIGPSVPPTADANGPYQGNEGEAVTLNASGSSDPEDNIATYEWDLDNDGEFDDATGVITEVVFGDNGTFTVGLRVTDDQGASDTDTAQVMVKNVRPSVSLDTSSAISFASGKAFLGRKDVGQTHQASATDPGSDDLTFSWSFDSIATYFNDGVGPDPFPSPGGTFPFSATDTASFTPTLPGVHLIEVKVIDDDLKGDEDRAFDRLPKLVTDNQECTSSQGFWKHQFREKGKKDDGQPSQEKTFCAELP